MTENPTALIDLFASAEDIYTTADGDQVLQWFDPVTGELTFQTCIRCHQRHKALKFSKRDNSPTGRSLKCYRCRSEGKKAKRRAEWLAAHPEEAAAA